MKIINGDSTKVLKKLKSNSVETIITDPPYGLSFMGKKWDYDVPGIDLWRECLRVLKPGGTLLCFAGSRTQHRMACNVEDAGFILKDCIMWLYGSGFPKATDLGKQLDKGHERKIIGSRKAHDIRNNNLMEASQGKNRGTMEYNYTEPAKPATPEAKLWNGWKSHGLKPAYEPILVAIKPNDGSYAENALKHGVSGLNIDGGRIGTEKRINKFAANGSVVGLGTEGQMSSEGQTECTGRFPANIILDEEAGKQLDEQTGELKSGDILPHHKTNESENTCMTGKNYKRSPQLKLGDKGGASRFFYCAKASKKERNAGCDELEKKTEEKRTPTGQGIMHEKGFNKPERNFHPTVKPLALMEYLCTLTKTPTGGLVLDPFMGSGTTCVACVNTGRDFIGIEKSKEYCEIAKKRIIHSACKHKKIKIKDKKCEPKIKQKIKYNVKPNGLDRFIKRGKNV